jgi:hypothetical protein
MVASAAAADLGLVGVLKVMGLNDDDHGVVRHSAFLSAVSIDDVLVEPLEPALEVPGQIRAASDVGAGAPQHFASNTSRASAPCLFCTALLRLGAFIDEWYLVCSYNLGSRRLLVAHLR